jgi:hypothetical protein
MPQGPPWISKAYPQNNQYYDRHAMPPVYQVNVDGYHLELDENEEYTVDFKFNHNSGNNNELSVHLAYPHLTWWEVIWTCNDYYPQINPQHVPRERFQNEDVFVFAYWKLQKGNPVDLWGACKPMSLKTAPGNGDWVEMSFVNVDSTSGVTVRIAHN